MLNSDVVCLFACRCLRMFSYGSVAVLLYVFLLNEYSASDVAILLSLTMFGDFIISLVISSRADKHLGRRNALCIGAVAKVLAGAGFSWFPTHFWILVTCATVGVITPSGGEIGPFLNVEQAALTDLHHRELAVASSNADELILHQLSHTMAWYQMAGGLSAAAGAVAAGCIVNYAQTLYQTPMTPPMRNVTYMSPHTFAFSNNSAVSSILGISNASLSVSRAEESLVPPYHREYVTQTYRFVFWLYTCVGLLKLVLYRRLSDRVEAISPTDIVEAADVECERIPIDAASVNDLSAQESSGVSSFVTMVLSRGFGLHTTRLHHIILKISALFVLDAFAGALVLQSYLALWFHERWGVSERTMGALVMGINVIGGMSGFVSSWLVRRIGAIATMVFTHLPSNVLLALIPLMPTEQTAVGMLMTRYCISQMDVPARQAYVNTVVPSSERSSANGITNSARSIGVCVAPLLLRVFLSSSRAMDTPFYAAALLKIVYDLTLYRLFSGTGHREKEAAVLDGTTVCDNDENSEAAPLTAARQESTKATVTRRYGTTH